TTHTYTLSLHDALPISRSQITNQLALFNDLAEGVRRDAQEKQIPPDYDLVTEVMLWLQERVIEPEPAPILVALVPNRQFNRGNRSEEHTSELQSQSNLV